MLSTRPETLRERFFESCRAPDLEADGRQQLRIAQMLDEEELRRLRQGLQAGVDSSAWAARILALEAAIKARAPLLGG